MSPERSECMPASCGLRHPSRRDHAGEGREARQDPAVEPRRRWADVEIRAAAILNQVADVHLPPPRPDIPGQPQRRCTAARVYDETRLNGRGRLAAGFAPAPLYSRLDECRPIADG